MRIIVSHAATWQLCRKKNIVRINLVARLKEMQFTTRCFKSSPNEISERKLHLRARSFIKEQFERCSSFCELNHILASSFSARLSNDFSSACQYQFSNEALGQHACRQVFFELLKSYELMLVRTCVHKRRINN